MIETQDLLPQATDGELFTINLKSSLAHKWFLFQNHPERSGVLDSILDGESNMVQFFGDYTALDRLEKLANTLLISQPDVASSHMLAAQVNSARHCFLQANENLTQAKILGANAQEILRIQLSIEQALGNNLESVLVQRQSLVKQSRTLENLVPLAALLADLGQYDDAHDTYLEALRSSTGLSPLGAAWACFQIGVLWGELHPEPDLEQAAYWYTNAVNYLPGYTHAAVHLAEIHLDNHKFDDCLRLLSTVLHTGDPEVRWRLSDLLAKQGYLSAATAEKEIARSMYEDLLSRHELAFADHAAEFYLGSGAQPERALELSLANFNNRSTKRAYSIALEAAQATGQQDIALKLSRDVGAKWGVLHD
jgi:tetratricopeptide (TPR) repeat protein